MELGEVVFLPEGDGNHTLAERERQAILDTLEATHGKLAETARRLGISRTTLWRRLRAYGLRPNGRNGR
jgi:transcriptional regulator of acetoin/glycerol metabolism